VKSLGIEFAACQSSIGEAPSNPEWRKSSRPQGREARGSDEFAGRWRSESPNPTSTEDGMHTVISADGTPIAFDRHGEGAAVILVNGALGYRKFKTMEQIATALSEHCTVINYDRRGRGDSGPAGPASVQREVEDLAALIDAVGGRASLWGYSSGSAVALRAAAAGLPVDKLVLYEVPFKTDPTAKFHVTTTRRGWSH
jgi:alpha-beta hydrolase superfamily lysophospholipase